MHDITTVDEVQAVLKPGGAMEAFEAAKKGGKCRLIGFTGHFDPDAHVAMLKAYDRWDTVMMPIHPADHAYLSFEQIALPVSAARGVPNQAIKVFGKANLLRSLSPSTCLRYALSQPGVSVAVCGCGTVGQMEDNIRAVARYSASWLRTSRASGCGPEWPRPDIEPSRQGLQRTAARLSPWVFPSRGRLRDKSRGACSR